jgi:hypothetical protein
MASASPKTSRIDRKLALREVVDWMVEDGLVEPAVGAKLIEEARLTRGSLKHPIASFPKHACARPSRRTRPCTPRPSPNGSPGG